MKYYTAILFDDNHGIENLHMTHKYLGELSDANILDIIETIDGAMNSIPPVNEIMVFDIPDNFGPTGKIRVLRPSRPFGIHSLVNQLSFIKSYLDRFNKDQYPSNPHVSVTGLGREWTELRLRPNRYALMCKGTVIESWNI